MYEKFLAEYEKLNIPSELNSLDEIAKVIEDKIKSFEENQDIRMYFIWLHQLAICGEDYLNLKNSKPKGIVNYLEDSNGTKIPDVESFEEERIEFYECCESQEKNLLLKIRLLNYLFDKSKKKFSFAKKLCECFKGILL